jgi:hypothetical protein
MDSYGSPRHAIVFFRRKDQSLTMRHNTGLTAAPARPLYGSPVCKRSPIQVLTVLNVAFNFRDRVLSTLHMAVGFKKARHYPRGDSVFIQI